MPAVKLWWMAKPAISRTPRDLPQLARCLVDLFNDPSLRRQFGNAGYARLQAQYSFSRFRDRFKAAISPLINGGATVNFGSAGIPRS